MLDAPQLDTWLARLLHARGTVDLPTLQGLLREVRRERHGAGPTLARLLVQRNHLPEAEVEGALQELGRVQTVPAPSLEPPGPSGAVGTRIGDYRLVARLGAGGMAVVYRAAHVETGVEHALKLLPGLGDPELLLRFQREGEAQAAVDGHPNLVRIHSAGAVAGHPYLVMDLADGGDLADRLREGPLDVEEATRVVAGVAAGLAHAHAAGVLHRDIPGSRATSSSRPG